MKKLTFKQTITVAVLLFSTFNTAFAQLIGGIVGGLVTREVSCRRLSISGPENLCVGENGSYSLNVASADQINWSVPAGEMTIVSISGQSIQSILAAAGLTVTNPLDASSFPPINTVSVSSNFMSINFNAAVNVNNNGMMSNFGADGVIDVTEVPFLRDLLSQRDINGTSIVATSLRPSFNANVIAEVQGARAEFLGIGGTITTGCNNRRFVRNVRIFGANFNSNISISATRPLDNIICGNIVNFSVPYIPRVGRLVDSWTVRPAGSARIDDFGNSANFTFVGGSGTFTVVYTAADDCGGVRQFTQNVIVNTPETRIFAGFDNNSPVTELRPNCNQADQGFSVRAEPFISRDAFYEWILPAGWTANGFIANTEVLDNGLRRRTIRGVNRRFLRLRQESQFAENGDVTLRVSNICGSDVQVLTIPLETQERFTVELPNTILQCNTSVDLTPIVSNNAVPPLNVTWGSSSLNGQFEQSRTQTNVTTVQNTFNVNRIGRGRITVRVEDSRGCTFVETASVGLLGGIDEDNPNVSGWLSGHINPQMRAAVASNLGVARGLDRVYFVEVVNGQRQMMFYEFNTSSQVWETRSTGITDLIQNGDNTVQYLNAGAANDYLFYTNSAGTLEVALIDRSTGRTTGFSAAIPEIEPREFEYAFQLEDINGSLVRTFWRDRLGNLFTGVIAFDFRDFPDVTLINQSIIQLTTTSPAFNDLVRFDLDTDGNRVFYFRSDGGFYMQNLNNPGVEIQLNDVLERDLVFNVTDVVLDTDGNAYYVADGDLFFVQFDGNGTYLGTQRLETSMGVLTPQIASRARGFLSINATTNTIYFMGVNGDIFQFVRAEDFETNPAFNIFKATPIAFNDRAQRSLIFDGQHLFYRSRDNQVHNLFFITEPELIDCSPRFLRQGAGDFTTTEAEQVDIAEGVLRGTVSPNPTLGLVNVDVWGAEGKGELSLYDLQGNRLEVKDYFFQAETVDISHLEAGVYILKVRGEQTKNTLNFRITKQ